MVDMPCSIASELLTSAWRNEGKDLNLDVSNVIRRAKETRELDSAKGGREGERKLKLKNR